MSVAFHTRPVLEHIVEQHAEEAAFLWTLRDAATDAPNYKRHHLARLDERVEAHVDGLRVAGAAGARIAMEQLEGRCEKGELFAASILALESGDRDRIDPLTALAATAEAPVRRGLVGAVAWCRPPLLAATVRRWTGSEEGFERYLALCACSAHRADAGLMLRARLSDANEAVRARALRLAGELGRVDLLEACLDHLEDSKEPSFWAAWSCVLLGDRDAALAYLEARALVNDRHRWAALELAVRAMGIERGRTFVHHLNADAGQRLLAVFAAGHLGDPAAVPWLITQMRDEQLARAAGASFSMITGVDLAYHDLDHAPVLEDEDSDSGEEDRLPWPDPGLVSQWWEQSNPGLSEGVRHLLGRPVDRSACTRAWEEGYQPQRRAAALERAVLKRDGPLQNRCEVNCRGLT